MKGEEEPAVRRRDFNDFQNAWVGLQDTINSLFDSERNPMGANRGVQPEEGIKQKLEKKEGLFRKNMMGKRVRGSTIYPLTDSNIFQVNYAARSGSCFIHLILLAIL